MKKFSTHKQVHQIEKNRSNTSNYTVNIIAYILRNDCGSYGPTAEEVMVELELMQSHFEPYDNCFSFLGIGEICDSDYVENWVVNHTNITAEITSNYGATSRMHIIFVPEEVADYTDNADFGGGPFAVAIHYFAIQ